MILHSWYACLKYCKGKETHSVWTWTDESNRLKILHLDHVWNKNRNALLLLLHTHITNTHTLFNPFPKRTSKCIFTDHRDFIPERHINSIKVKALGNNSLFISNWHGDWGFYSKRLSNIMLNYLIPFLQECSPAHNENTAATDRGSGRAFDGSISSDPGL